MLIERQCPQSPRSGGAQYELLKCLPPIFSRITRAVPRPSRLDNFPVNHGPNCDPALTSSPAQGAILQPTPHCNTISRRRNRELPRIKPIRLEIALPVNLANQYDGAALDAHRVDSMRRVESFPRFICDGTAIRRPCWVSSLPFLREPSLFLSVAIRHVNLPFPDIRDAPPVRRPRWHEFIFLIMEVVRYSLHISPICIHYVNLHKSFFSVRCKSNLPSVGRPRRVAVIRRVVCERFLVASVGAHHVYFIVPFFNVQYLLTTGLISYLISIGRPVGMIVPRTVRQPDWVPAIGVDHPDLNITPVSIGNKRNLRPVRRPRWLGILRVVCCDRAPVFAVGIHYIDIRITASGRNERDPCAVRGAAVSHQRLCTSEHETQSHEQRDLMFD